MRRFLKILGVLLGLALLSVGAAWVAFYVGTPAEGAPGSEGPRAPSAAAVPGSDAASFPKQGDNQCGAYSLAEGLRLHGVSVTGAELAPLVARQYSWSDSLSGTMPWRVIEESRRRGVPAEGYTARALAGPERLDALRAHLSRGRPVVLLIESERRSQHFVLLVGYGAEGFYEYDPNFKVAAADPSRTVDENGPLPGNRTLSPETLLEMWSKGGIAGLYTWWYVPLGR